MSHSLLRYPILALWLAHALGCSSASAVPGEPDTGGPSPWRETSRRVALESFGYWEGSSRFEADREQLTPEQLMALSSLRRIPTPSGPVGNDFVSYRVAITDADGSVARYRAAQSNIKDGDEPDQTLATLDVYSLGPFLHTFDCLTASETRGGIAAMPGAGAPPEDGSPLPPNLGPPENWSDAPAVSTAAPGCFHGVFVPYECHDVWLDLEVAAAGSYELRAEDCFEQLEIGLFSPDDGVRLATAFGARDACPVLSQTFEQAGSYPLRLRKTNAAGCSERGTAGDFFFRVEPAAR